MRKLTRVGGTIRVVMVVYQDAELENSRCLFEQVYRGLAC
jgi:hypothetical protein